MLDELNDVSKLAPEKEKLNERDILVINPYKFEDEKRKKLKERLHSMQMSSQNLMTPNPPQFSLQMDAKPDDKNLFETIDAMNVHSIVPESGLISLDVATAAPIEISKNEYNKLLSNIATSFQKKQLKDYISKRLAGAVGYASKNKTKLSDIIITQIWNLRISDKPNFNELRETKRMKLSRPDIHLLLLLNGRIIQNVMKTGVKVSLLKDRGAVCWDAGANSGCRDHHVHQLAEVK